MIVTQIKRALVIAKKDLAVYYARGPVLVFGLLMPAFLFLAFSIRRDISLTFLFPGLLSMALFFSVSSIGPIIAPWETRMKTYERLVSAPITIWAIILGDVIASMLYGLLITLVIITVGVLFLGLNLLSLELLAGTILAALSFASLGVLLSFPPTDNPSNINMLATMIKFPLLFISGVFIPLSEMGNAKVLAYFSPLSYYTDLVSHAVGGGGYFTIPTDLAMLLLFGIVILVLTIKLHSWSITKRF